MPTMNGTERFSANGKETGMAISDFWIWAYSGFSDYSRYSVLAEYIVASALELTDAKVRQAGFMKKRYDLLTRDGTKVNVRSAAYAGSMDAERPDCISFHISPSGIPGGDGKTKQASDAYIFCIYKGMEASDSPLNLDLWEFYVLQAKKLDEKKPGQKTITLPSLMELEPLWCDYYGIGEAIMTAVNARDNIRRSLL